jgi:hypothetical protein
MSIYSVFCQLVMSTKARRKNKCFFMRVSFSVFAFVCVHPTLFPDQSVRVEDIASRLRAKSIPAQLARIYAEKLLKDAFGTPRMLAAVRKPDLIDMGFAPGHQAVTIETFEEWVKGLTSPRAGEHAVLTRSILNLL